MNEKSHVVSDNVNRTLGREAQRNNILAARVIADIVKTTLGPKGMDKMLVDSVGNVTITNDGATILEEMELDHPAAKLIVDMAKTQEHEVGDGTTTVAMLAGALLSEAEKLLDRRIHPTAIVKGYRLAARKTQEILNALAVRAEDREILRKIALTAMTGKGAENYRDLFADLIVNAVTRVAQGREVHLSDISIAKVSGKALDASTLIEGVIVDKNVAHVDMPRHVSAAKIALLDFPIEVRGPEMETKVSVSSPEQWRSFLENEELFLKELVGKIVASGARVVFCQKGIDDVAQYYLAQAGIMAVRRVSRSEMERLSRATGGKIVAHVHELTTEQLGYAGSVLEMKHGNDMMIEVRECKHPRSVTMMVCASTPQVLDETERAINDALGVVASALRNGTIVAGGGAVELALSKRLVEYSHTLSGRDQLGVEAFARALETIPETLAENAGLDPIEILTELKKRHEAGDIRAGLNLIHDRIEDTFAAGIIEPLQVKSQAIAAASEVAMLLLRVDDVLISKGTRNSVKADPMQGLD